MPRRPFVSVLVVLGFTSACADARAPAEGASLPHAVERTTSAEGFHIEGTLTIGETTIHTIGDYVAPDRIAVTSTGGSTPTTTIVVGRSYYGSEPDDPHTFSVWEMPCDLQVDTFISALSVVRDAEDVEQDGSSFVFRAEGEGISIEGEARSQDGYLVELVLRYTIPRIDQSVEEQWTFSDFGAVVRIEPPPGGKILDQSRFDANPPIVIQTGQAPECPTV